MDVLLVVVIAGLVGLFLFGRSRRRPEHGDVTGMQHWSLWLFGGWLFWGAGAHDTSTLDHGPAIDSGNLPGGGDIGGGDFGGGGF